MDKLRKREIAGSGSLASSTEVVVDLNFKMSSTKLVFIVLMLSKYVYKTLKLMLLKTVIFHLIMKVISTFFNEVKSF